MSKTVRHYAVGVDQQGRTPSRELLHEVRTCSLQAWSVILFWCVVFPRKEYDQSNRALASIGEAGSSSNSRARPSDGNDREARRDSHTQTKDEQLVSIHYPSNTVHDHRSISRKLTPAVTSSKLVQR